jgi:hypothetical protein
VRTIKLSVGAHDDGVAGYLVRLLEGIDTDDPTSTTDVLARAHVEATRPRDAQGDVLDSEGIRRLLLRDEPLPSEGELQRIGDYLHGLLAHGKVGERWAELRALYPRERPPTEGLRLLLHIADDELRLLPWELARREDVWVFADPRNVFARIRDDYHDDLDGREDWWPLRIVVVVGAEDNDEGVQAEQEIERINEALAKVLPDVDPEFLVRPAREALAADLERLNPHLLHFIGHGVSTPTGGALIMHDDATGARWDWTASDITNSLAITPQIVVLNACRSGELGAQQGTWQVADAFTKLGVPAVIAMQGDIDGRAAAAFAAGFFEALLAGELLDVAVSRGRRRVADKMTFARRDFCLPTLTLSEPAERAVPKRYAIDDRKLMEVEAVLPVAAFVDRTLERRGLLDQLTCKEARAEGLLTAIEGESEVGKTVLVQWALRQLAYRGRDVVYVDLRTPDRTPRTQVGVLRAIRDAVRPVRPAPPEDPRSFHAWTRDLNHLVHGEPPPKDPVGAPEPDANDEYDADQSDLDQIFAGFLTVLGAVAENEPLLIALDHLEAISQRDLETDLAVGLIRPLASGRVGRVRLLLAGTGVQGALPGLSPGLNVTVPSFRPEDKCVLITQYLLYHDCWSEERRRFVAGLRGTTKPWKPTDFEKMLTLAGGF